MRKKIVITPQSFLPYKKLILKKLSNFEIIFLKGPIDDKKILAKKLKNAFGCIIGSEKIDKELISKFDKMKLLHRYGTSLDNIDIDECKKKKIKLLKLDKKINAKSVARHTMSLLLSITNNLKHYNQIAKKNLWQRKMNLSPELTKIGIIGMGNIGKLFLNYLKNFNFVINYYSRKKKKIKNVRFYNNIKDLILNSHIISIHLPYNNKTKKIFNSSNLKLLRNKILINTSRGNLYDEKIIYDMLKKRYLRYAALDVFKSEPTTGYSSKLRKLPNVLSTCHSSFYDEFTIDLMVKKTIENISKKL